MTYTAEEKWREAKREAEVRERVYPRWIRDGRTTMQEAKIRLDIMKEMAEDYHALMVKERLL
jgi:hypothetical protein